MHIGAIILGVKAHTWTHCIVRGQLQQVLFKAHIGRNINQIKINHLLKVQVLLLTEGNIDVY